MAPGDPLALGGGSRRRLAQVAAATSPAAAGRSLRSAPASTSQRQRNQIARQAALDHDPPMAARAPFPSTLMRTSQSFSVLGRLHRPREAAAASRHHCLAQVASTGDLSNALSTENRDIG